MGCSIDSSETKTVYLDSSKSVCFGMIRYLCFRSFDSRSDYDNQTENYQVMSNINGFDYHWGTRYILVIRETTISNPPADGSSLRRELVSIESQTEDPIGTEYLFESISLQESAFRIENNQYLFLDQAFECEESTNCDELLNLDGQDATVNLTFVYLGDGEIQLQNWN